MEKPDFMSRLVGGAMLLVAGMVLGGLSFFYIHDLAQLPSLQELNRKIAQVHDWKVVTGEMDAMDIQPNEEGGFQHYSARVKYHYTVDNQQYNGDCFSIYTCIYHSTFVNEHENLLSHMQPYTAGKPVDVRYDPANPSLSVLDTKYETIATAGSNENYELLSWNDYYGGELFCVIFFGFLSVWILAKILRLFVPAETIPAEPPGRITGKMTASTQARLTKTVSAPVPALREIPVQTASMTVLRRGFGIFLLICAYEIWWVNIHKVQAPDIATQVLVGLLVMLFAGLGIVSFLRSDITITIDRNTQTVSEVFHIWLVLLSWPWKLSWPFSDFADVLVSQSYYSIKGSSGYYCTVSLGFVNNRRRVVLASVNLHSNEIPADMLALAEEVSKMLGLPLSVKKFNDNS